MCVTLKVVPEMQSLQKPATTFMMKKGIQQSRNTPIIIPIVIAAWKRLQDINIFAGYIKNGSLWEAKPILKYFQTYELIISMFFGGLDIFKGVEESLPHYITLCSCSNGESLSVTRTCFVPFFSSFLIFFFLFPLLTWLSIRSKSKPSEAYTMSWEWGPCFHRNFFLIS